MLIDAYAHIVPPRFAARVERLIAERGLSDRLTLFAPWGRERRARADQRGRPAAGRPALRAAVRPHAVRCAVEFFGPDHVLFGTDMPLGGPAVISDTVADLRGLGSRRPTSRPCSAATRSACSASS